VNAAFFAAAAVRRTDVVTDLSYSLTFALLALVLPFTGTREPVQLAASFLVLVWALRLGAYLFRRILRMKLDHRFDGIRDEPLRFARFWFLQAITVAVVMLPVAYLLDRNHPPGFGPWAVAGACVWLAGFVIEAVADAQKSAFRANDENRGRFMASGLWLYSRHPNYFGEMLVWWGLFVYVVPVLHGAAFAVVAGPVFITMLLLFVSGIPPLERSADEK
jgi:steroid 5-alpha reductase family enzyme